MERIGEIRDKLNLVTEDIAMWKELTFETNCDFTENVKKIEVKLVKLQTRYASVEQKSRSDVLEYISKLDDYTGNVTNAQSQLIEEILCVVHSYEVVFGSEFPDDIQTKIDILKSISTGKRRLERNEEQQSKRQKMK